MDLICPTCGRLARILLVRVVIVKTVVMDKEHLAGVAR